MPSFKTDSSDSCWHAKTKGQGANYPSTTPATYLSTLSVSVKATAAIVHASVLAALTVKQVAVVSAGSVPPTVKPSIKVAPAAMDSFMVRHFKLAGTEKSRVLILNQVTEVFVDRVIGNQTQVWEEAMQIDDGNDTGTMRKRKMMKMTK
ncbi:hypothetical protein C0995_001114, partial [Termitomyces sp. Mi166